MPWDGFRRGKDCLFMLLSTNSKIVEHMPHLLFISRFAGSNGGIEGYQRDMARLLRGNGFTVDFAWLESGRDPEKFLPAFDANMTLDDALRRPDAYDLVVVHKLFDLDKLRAVQEHFRHTALFVHDHDIYCPRHHYYTPFGRTNCHRRFQTLRCGFCAFASHPKHWEGGLKAYAKSLFRDFPKRLEIFKGFPKIAVLSDFMRRNLVLNGFDNDKITIIPPCVELADGKTEPLPKRPIQLLFSGQLIRGKGLDILLEALPKAKADFHLDVMGAGSDLPLLQSIVEKNGLQENVTFLGWISDKTAVYQQHDVLLMPSRWQEPFGLVGIEAAAHGLPIVAFDLGGIHEYVRNNVNGFLIPEYDVDGFIAAIDRLAADPELLLKMGRESQAVVREKFTPDMTLSAFRKWAED